DKNVKIWGMDFGDCHKSLFAHDDSIMQVAFEPRTHNFFSISKDKWVKYWDGDKGLSLIDIIQFELIQKLDGHQGEIWALAAGIGGKVIVTGSQDKSIRIWENTEEALFLEEEREKEMERLYEGDIADEMNREDGIIGSRAEGAIDDPLASRTETTMVQKHTMESLMAGEKIIEALELADRELEGAKEYANAIERLPVSEKNKVGPPPRNPVLSALDITPELYVLKTVEKVQPSALYDALLVIPFSKVTSLLHYMDIWASQKSQISYNLAALKYIKRQEESARTAEFYERAEREEWAEDELQTLKERIQKGESRKRKR
ncbi:4111_t:CDS:2, partial [Acaulospora colombiana]